MMTEKYNFSSERIYTQKMDGTYYVDVVHQYIAGLPPLTPKKIASIISDSGHKPEDFHYAEVKNWDGLIRQVVWPITKKEESSYIKRLDAFPADRDAGSHINYFTAGRKDDGTWCIDLACERQAYYDEVDDDYYDGDRERMTEDAAAIVAIGGYWCERFEGKPLV